MTNQINHDEIIYELNESEKTCRVIGNYSTSSDIFIPRSIYHGKFEYVVKSIEEKAFENSNSFSVQFAPDSELQTIECSAFSSSTIERISIPSSLIELKNGWCEGASNLIKVSIMPNNQRYQSCDDQFVIEKGDKLVFVRRDIKSFSIPTNIKIIESYSFEYSSIESVFIPPQITRINENAFAHCKHLKKVEIPSDSLLETIENYAFNHSVIENIFIPKNIKKIPEGLFFGCKKLYNVEFSTETKLQTIEKFAFFESSIESLSIPSTVTKLNDGWCKSTEYLKKVTIMPNNQFFKNDLNGNVVVGKSDVKKTEFDVLVFANRNMKSINIPSNIEQIAQHSFAFSSIEKVFIPSSVKSICTNAFYWCYELTQVEISDNSQLKTIDSLAFSFSLIECFFVPPNVENIDKTAFYRCRNLKIIEIDGNLNAKKIKIDAFFDANKAIIMVPIKLVNDFINFK